MYYYDIILPIPLKGILTYYSRNELSNGTRVEVSIGNKLSVGIVYRQSHSQSSNIRYKEINRVLDGTPMFNHSWIRFIEQMSLHYNVDIGASLYGVLPKTILSSDKFSLYKPICYDAEDASLNDEQRDLTDKLFRKLNSGFSVNLIHGVTGSGKTEVYIECIKKVLENGGQALYIVPEISLTTQLMDRISERIGFDVPSYHSKLSPKKREDIFFSFAEGKIPFIIGARSALFIPHKSLSLVIIDEEHESSFKQEDIPYYNLRDMAVLYSSILKIPVILGSATPSIESYYNSITGKYSCYKLNKKFYNDSKVSVSIIDMKNEEKISGIVSIKLYDKIFETVSKGEQAVLLVNRKGYSPQMICSRCGTHLKCSNCNVLLTFYKSSHNAKCNYCGEKFYNFKCRECGNDSFFESGVGAEKAYEALDVLFPGKVIRLDTDIITSQKRLNSIINDFADMKYQIMVGTQLIAKGLNFPKVTLAAILNIENMFSLPDFRSNERIFNLLVQLAGRGGRFFHNSEFVIQTYNPDLPVFEMVLSGNFDIFYENELKNRQMLGYPPYCKLVRIILSHTNYEKLLNVSDIIGNNIKNNFSNKVKVLGPVEAPISKIKNRYRFHLILKVSSYKEMNICIEKVKDLFSHLKEGGMQMKIDVDPYFFM